MYSGYPMFPTPMCYPGVAPVDPNMSMSPGVLILGAGGREIVTGLPPTLEAAMSTARDRWAMPPNLYFRLGVHKKDAPPWLAATAQGDYVLIGDDSVYQLLKCGKPVLRTEIIAFGVMEKGFGDPLATQAPPQPEPIPMRFSLFNEKDKACRLDVKGMPSVNLDWNAAQTGSAVQGRYVGELVIKPQNDAEGRIVFHGQKLPNAVAFNNFAVEGGYQLKLRNHTARSFVSILSPEDQFLTFELTLSAGWRATASWPMAEVIAAKEKQTLPLVLRANKDGSITDVNTGIQAAGVHWEATPNLGAPRQSKDDQEPFDPANPDLVDYNAVLLEANKMPERIDQILKDLGIPLQQRSHFIADLMPYLARHNGYIAFRFLQQDFFDPAAVLSIRPSPHVIGRVFLLFQGVPNEYVGDWKESRKRGPLPIDWATVIGYDKSNLAEKTWFRVIELGAMEVVP